MSPLGSSWSSGARPPLDEEQTQEGDKGNEVFNQRHYKDHHSHSTHPPLHTLVISFEGWGWEGQGGCFTLSQLNGLLLFADNSSFKLLNNYYKLKTSIAYKGGKGEVSAKEDDKN